MSVNLGHVFARVFDTDQLYALILEHLKSPLHATDPQSRKLYNDKGERTVTVFPPVRGWSLIVESEHRQADASLAHAISKHFSARTIWLTVSGCVFDYEWIVYEKGNEQQRGALRDSYPLPPEMPLYQDAELLAWEQALKWNLPSQLLFLRPEMIPDDHASTTKLVFFKVKDVGGVQEVCAYAKPVRMPIERIQPVVTFDTVLGKDGTAQTIEQIQCATEMRFLYGEPTPKAQQNLEMLLRRLQNRYSRATGLPKDKIKFIVRAGERCSMEVQMPNDLQ